MNTESSIPRAQALRLDFDAAFALPFPNRDHASIDYLRIVVSGVTYALAVRQIAGIAVDVEWTFVPSSIDEFLGLTCYRGKLVPIFDLGKVLGHPASKEIQGILLAAQAPVGFTFSKMIGIERIIGESEALSASEQLPHSSAHSSARSSAHASAQELIHCNDGEHVAVLEIAALLAHIERRIASTQRTDGRGSHAK